MAEAKNISTWVDVCMQESSFCVCLESSFCVCLYFNELVCLSISKSPRRTPGAPSLLFLYAL